MKKQNLLFTMFIFTVFILGFTNTIATENTKAISVNLVNQDPDPALAGEIFDVRISIENAGGKAAEDLMLEIKPSYPLKLVPGQSNIVDLGTIGSYQSGDDKKIIKFELMTDADAPKGIYELSAFYYEKNSATKIEKKLNIEINNQNIAEISQINKIELLPGRTELIKFVVKNVGNSPLKDVVFMWENDDEIILPVGSDNTRYISEIKVGESKEVEYFIMADNNAVAGLYKLNLYLSSSNDQTSKIVSTNAGIYVGGKTDFEAAFSSSSELDYSFSIANIGSNPAYSVSVSIPDQDSWKTTGANSVIIGNLNNGDYTIATFNLVPKLNSSSKSPLTLRISYTDTTGNRVSADKEVLFNTQTQSTGIVPGSRSGMRGTSQPQTSFSFTTVGIILAVIIISIIFLKLRKQKRGKKK